MDWRITVGVLGIGVVYLLLALYRGRLVTYRTIEKAKEPQPYWFNIALLCICLALVTYGLIGG